MSKLEPIAKRSIQRYYMKVKYQDKQPPVAQDFLDDQNYHSQKLRDHNRLLHTHGICEGMIVTSSKTAFSVEVSAGLAVDAIGNQILLAAPETVDLSISALRATSVLLTIRYGEIAAPDKEYNEVEGGIRTLEKPIFEAWPLTTQITDTNILILAAITRNADGTIISCDSNPKGRLTAGVRLSAIGTNGLLPQSVTTDKIQDGAVTEAKIATNSVTTGKVSSNAITTEKINPMSVTEPKIADNAVTSAKIKDKSVTYEKMGFYRNTTEVSLNPGADYAISFSVNNEQRLLPAIFKVYSTEMGYEVLNLYPSINAVSVGGTANGKNVYWYEGNYITLDGNSTQRLYISNRTDNVVKLRYVYWRWE